LKILFHHRIRSQDGQYVHLREMVEAFSALGHDVRLVGPKISERNAFGKGGSTTAWVRRTLPAWVGECVELTYAIWAAVRLFSRLLIDRPAFVYERFNLFSPAGVIVCRWLSVPLVLEINSPLYEERDSNGGVGLKSIAEWSQRFTWRWASLCCPVSAVLGHIVHAAGVPCERILVRHNGIDPTRFNTQLDRVEARKRRGLQGRCVLGFIGFLREWHRVDRIVNVMAQRELPVETHLVIAGDGPALEGLKAQVVRCGLQDRVTFLGLVHWSEVPDLLACFDIALQPAVTPYASPLKLIEYLACGLAILAPDQDNIRELIVHGENGWIFDAASSESLAAELRILCDDPALRDRLGRGAQDTVDALGLTWRHNAQAVIDCLAQRGQVQQ
jgi:glycosyltransferase involved in cell wall biosynthesis